MFVLLMLGIVVVADGFWQWFFFFFLFFLFLVVVGLMSVGVLRTKIS